MTRKPYQTAEDSSACRKDLQYLVHRLDCRVQAPRPEVASVSRAVGARHSLNTLVPYGPDHHDNQPRSSVPANVIYVCASHTH